MIEDLQLPLPGDLRDIAKAAPLVSGVVEDRIPQLLNSVRERTWDEDGALHAYEFRRFTIGFPDILLVERANPDNVLFQMEAKCPECDGLISITKTGKIRKHIPAPIGGTFGTYPPRKRELT